MIWQIPMHFTARYVPTEICTNAFYNKYRRMISNAAWKATKVCTESYDELFSRGNALFCKALKTWDKEKGSFSTHLGWALKTLNRTAAEMYAPTDTKGVKNFWNSLEASVTGKDGEEISSDPLEASRKYSQKMAESVDDASWEARIPDFRKYMNVMDSDTRQLCNDILDGYFEMSERTGKIAGEKARLAHVTEIPATRMYSKRYIKFGWTLQRTKNALDNLRQSCRRWLANKAPVECISVTIDNVDSADLF